MSDQKVRSPKFPSMSLKEAVLEIAKVYEAEDRNKMSRSVLAAHLGYTSLSGASASKIGALRHFGLIEGSGDSLWVSDLSITLVLKSPKENEYLKAVKEAVRNPTLYNELLEKYSSKPSLANLEYNLIQRGFLKKSAAGAAQDFLDSADFANCWVEETPTSNQEDNGEPDDVEIDRNETTALPKQPQATATELPLAQGEEEISSGRLSRSTKYRLLVSGEFGVRELDLLIQKLELDRSFLE
ncbi:hypothetical protein [Roseobacter litoralis]|uniref:hypothetical protein n=1 Tax=Roseobacter litoralis TaxID=42443 RepID=UPI0024949C9D|nr:hypothetical protein [Roseobacter litoralis]